MSLYSGTRRWLCVTRASQFVLILSAILFTARAATSAPVVDLGTLGGTFFPFTQAVAVNDSGQVVGVSYPAGGAHLHAFSWTAAGGMIDLGTLGGTTLSRAVAVNASGQVVGSSGTVGAPESHVVLWVTSGVVVDPGGPRPSAAEQVHRRPRL